MPALQRLYRVRVHDGVTATATFTNPAVAGGNALVVTSQRGGPNPYLAGPPSGDGQTLDPITGKVEVGAYRVRVLDATPSGSGTDRIVTAVLADATARWQLLSRLAAVEWSTNDGGTWATLLIGYLNAIKLVDAITWDFSIGETRRAELAVELFKRLAPPSVVGGVLTSPACLVGGPIRAGAAYNTKVAAFADVRDVGPVRVQAAVAPGGEAPGQLALSLVGGWLAPYYDELDTSIQAHELIALNHYARPFFVGGIEAAAYGAGSDWRVYGSFPGLVAELKPVGGGTTRYLRPLAAAARRRGSFVIYAAAPDPDGPVGPYDEFVTRQGPAFRLAWDVASMGAKPAAGTQFDLVIYAAEPSAQLPLHERGHPVDLVTQKWAALGVRYDAAAAAAARAAIDAAYGGAVVCELTWDAPIKLTAYAQQLLAFFGVGVRVDQAGALACVGLRHTVPAIATPITLADLREPDSETFELAESSAITTAELRTREFLFTRAVFEKGAPIADFAQIPLDNLRPAWHTVEGATDETAALGTERAHRWELPGRVLVDGVAQRAEDLALIAGSWLVNWRRRGAPTFLLRCLPSVTAQVGDQVPVSVPHLPVAVVGAVPVTQRGQAAVTVRVLQRTETPEGPDLRVILAPPLAQLPLAAVIAAGAGATTLLVPELSVMRSTSDGARVALVDLENAEDLVAGRQLLALEYAVQASAPAGSGTPLGPFDPADAASSPVRYALPAATPDAVIWVRGRSELRAGGTSTWTPWQWVTLAADTSGAVPVMPVVKARQEVLSSTVGRLHVTVFDPQGRSLTLRTRTQTGGGAWSAAVAPSFGGDQYYVDVALVEGATAGIEWALTFTAADGSTAEARASETFDLAAIPIVHAVQVRGHARATQASPYEVGKASAEVQVDARAKSIRVAASTAGFPDAAAVAASALVLTPPIGTRSIETASLGTLSYGQTMYVSVLAYPNPDGTGTPSVLQRGSTRYGESSTDAIGKERLPATTVYTDSASAANFQQRPQYVGNALIATNDVAVLASITFQAGGAIGAVGGYAGGSVAVGGSKGGYAGVVFTDYGRTLFANATEFGYGTDSAYQFAFTNGALSHGTVPASRVTPGGFGAGNYIFDGGLEVVGALSLYSTLDMQGATLKIGKAASAQGGSVVFRDDGGTERYRAGVLPDAGARDFTLRDTARGATILSASASTGQVTFADRPLYNGNAFIAANDAASLTSVSFAGGGSVQGIGNFTYGSLVVAGSKGTYAGLYFQDPARYLYASATEFGYGTAEAYQFAFTNGVLTTGSVPAARVSAGSMGAGNFTFSAAVTATEFVIGASSITGPSGSYGSLTVNGSQNGYAGFQFPAISRAFMSNGSSSGMWTGSVWQWRFDGGSLEVGSVPAARLTAGTAGIGQYVFQGNAGRAMVLRGGPQHVGTIQSRAPLVIDGSTAGENSSNPAAIAFSVPGSFVGVLDLTSQGIFEFRNASDGYASLKVGAFESTSSITGVSAAISGAGNFGSLLVGGVQVAGEILSTSAPSGVYPVGTGWNQVSGA